ncbi:toll/interleukin-1 receptor domain-containing protein [Ferruginibacter profundus]
MPYINDVFISYKRGKINEQWLNEIFLPLFSEYLNNELPFEPKIFVDRSGLTPGVNFNDELFVNLLYSKCIVSIWSPPYFRRSDWCVKEFLTMKHRQEVLELSPLTDPKTLIWSVLYREVVPIPELADGLSYLDYTDFNLVGDAFFKTEKYLAIQEKMKKDIKTIAAIITKAPALKPEWETIEGRKQIVNELNEYFKKYNLENELKQEPITWQVK